MSFEILRARYEEQQARKWDDKNKSILAQRIEAFDKKKGPRVGDFIYMKGEKEPRRFTYKWDDGLQTTNKGAGGSFYLGEGYISFSGGLDSIVPNEAIEEVTGETKEGRIWFFDHDLWGADRGIETNIRFRVFKQL